MDSLENNKVSSLVSLSCSAKGPGALQVNLNQTGIESSISGRTRKHLKARRIKYKLVTEELLGQHCAISPPGFSLPVLSEDES